MRTIYVDAEYRCHVTDDGTMRAFEMKGFDGKCNEYIKGYRYIPAGERWQRDDGVTFYGEALFPWKQYYTLDAVQREYERQQISDMQSTITELDAALLESTYQNIIGGV